MLREGALIIISLKQHYSTIGPNISGTEFCASKWSVTYFKKPDHRKESLLFLFGLYLHEGLCLIATTHYPFMQMMV